MSAALAIPAADERLVWSGAIDREHGDGWVQPWRLPLVERPLWHEALHGPAASASGVRIALATDAAWLEGVVAAPIPQTRPVALVADGGHVADAAIGADGRFRFPTVPAARRLELWLPQNAPLRLVRLEVPAGAGVAPPPPLPRRWITYGSSITHGNEAASPALTWPARVARALGVDLVSLGFGGQCHLDPLVARLIARTPCDAVSIKAGINIYGQSSLGPRTFRANLVAFVRLVRDGHPGIPIVVCSPIFSPVREAYENKVGLTLQTMRAEVAAAVAALRAAGDAALHHVDGLALLGPADRDRLPDFLHPDTEGHRLIAERFLAAVGAVIAGR